MNFKTQESFVLASASPRRKELFEMLGLNFKIVTSNVEETSIGFENDMQYVRDVALLKARDIANKMSGHTIIGADTIVSFDGRLLHKPKTHEEAILHIHALRGQTHAVLTAVAIIDKEGNENTFIEKTTVRFKQVSDALIEAYVRSGDPFDKAGGYGIQTSGALLVDQIEGDYNNVVGLPIASLAEQLLTLNLITI